MKEPQSPEDWEDEFRRLSREFPKFKPAAFHFVMDGFAYAATVAADKRNIPPRELLECIVAMALERYGFLARTVAKTAGLTCSGRLAESLDILVEARHLHWSSGESVANVVAEFSRIDFLRALENRVELLMATMLMVPRPCSACGRAS